MLGQAGEVGYIDKLGRIDDISSQIIPQSIGAGPDRTVWLCGHLAGALARNEPLALVTCDEYLENTPRASIELPFVAAMLSDSLTIDSQATLWLGLSWPYSVLKVGPKF